MRNSRRWQTACLFSAVAMVGSVSNVYGNADSWKTAVSGNWAVGTNWVDGSTPGNGDSANFNVFGSYTVTFSASPVDIQSLSVLQGTMILNSSGGVKTLSIDVASGGQNLNVSGANTGFFVGTSSNAMAVTMNHALSVQSGSTMQIGFGSHVSQRSLAGGIERNPAHQWRRFGADAFWRGHSQHRW